MARIRAPARKLGSTLHSLERWLWADSVYEWSRLKSQPAWLCDILAATNRRQAAWCRALRIQILVSLLEEAGWGSLEAELAICKRRDEAVWRDALLGARALRARRALGWV